nr:hypothetical protein [Tanacetum cinerariifolium]
PHVIPYCRFTKLIIYYLRRIHNIHQWSGSPLNLAKDDLSLGNLKGRKKKSASKADKPKKPVPSKQSKPAPATKPKVGQEKPSESSPTKHPKRGKVQKVDKGKSHLKLIDKDEEVHHELEPQGEDEDYDLNRAIQMSLETFHAHGQAPVGGRRTPATEEASTRPSTQPHDDGSTNIVRDTPSHADAKTGANTDITTSTANTKVLYAEDVQENPLSSPGTLSSMNNVDDAFTFDDHVLNDMPTEEEPGKTTIETEAENQKNGKNHPYGSNQSEEREESSLRV